MSARIIAPKMASMAASSSIKAARPMFRAGLKPTQVQANARTFSSKAPSPSIIINSHKAIELASSASELSIAMILE